VLRRSVDLTAACVREPFSAPVSIASPSQVAVSRILEVRLPWWLLHLHEQDRIRRCDSPQQRQLFCLVVRARLGHCLRRANLAALVTTESFDLQMDHFLGSLSLASLSDLLAQRDRLARALRSVLVLGPSLLGRHLRVGVSWLGSFVFTSPSLRDFDGCRADLCQMLPYKCDDIACRPCPREARHFLPVRVEDQKRDASDLEAL